MTISTATRTAILGRLQTQADNNAAKYAELDSRLGRQQPTREAEIRPYSLTDYIETVRQLPCSKYALLRKDGGLDFVEVTERNGRNWVTLLIGAPGDWRRVKMSYRLMHLAAQHIAQDPKAAAKRFADEFRCCAKCQSPLSDPISRQLGLGPDCRKAF